MKTKKFSGPASWEFVGQTLKAPETFSIFSSHSQAQAAGQGAADEQPAAQPPPADPPAQNEAEPEPPDVPPDQGDDPELEEEEGAAAEDADPNNGAQGWNQINLVLKATCWNELNWTWCVPTFIHKK